MSHPCCVLAVGGLDSTGNAGLAADLRAGAALNAFVSPVATAVTVQDQQGVRRVLPLAPDLIGEQIAAVRRSLPVAAVKVGLLPGPEQARAVADALRDYGGPMVLDPVLSATVGGALVAEGLPAVLAALFSAKTTVLTPNLPEAGILLGRPAADNRDEMRTAALGLRGLGFAGVFMKGGHLKGPQSPDYLLDTGAGLWIEGARLDTPNTRGTGCVLATLIAVLLAQGQPLRLACIGGKNALVILLRKGEAHRWPLGPGPIL